MSRSFWGDTLFRGGGSGSRFAPPSGVAGPAPTPGPSVWTRTEAALTPNPPFVVGGGGWSEASTASASGGTHVRSSVTGDSLSFTFTGTGIRLIVITTTSGGIASVSIDGGTPEDVDTYSGTTGWQVLAFEKTGLTDTQHTIKIEVTGRKNPSATGATVYLDAFDVGT